MRGTDDIQERLKAISEELADLAMDRLREALADGEETTGKGATGRASRRGGGATTDEHRLTRARRAVDNAVSILSAGDAPEG